MSNCPKITLEKRVFKLNENENFVLEYPSNYEDVVNKKLNNLQKDYELTIKNNVNNNNIEDKSEEDRKEDNEKEEINIEQTKPEISDNKYYQKLDNNDNSLKKEEDKEKQINLEPQEGFIEINKNENKKENNNESDNEEYYEVEEIEKKEINNNKEKQMQKNEKNLSPIKNPEDIKLSMKKLNFKPPKWAENMTDKDFINMAKNMISSKNDSH